MGFRSGGLTKFKIGLKHFTNPQHHIAESEHFNLLVISKKGAHGPSVFRSNLIENGVADPPKPLIAFFKVRQQTRRLIHRKS